MKWVSLLADLHTDYGPVMSWLATRGHTATNLAIAKGDKDEHRLALTSKFCQDSSVLKSARNVCAARVGVCIALAVKSDNW